MHVPMPQVPMHEKADWSCVGICFGQDCGAGRGCSGTFTNVWGLPCRHRIWSLMNQNKALELSDVNTQWMLHDSELESETHSKECATSFSPCSKTVNAVIETFGAIDYATSVNLAAKVGDLLRSQTTPVQNPGVVQRKRGRPRGSKNRANKRDRSAFEYVEGSKCTNCGGAGHNAVTCPN